MSPVTSSDVDFIERHRRILAIRPELRSVYQEWFGQLLRHVDGLDPLVEIGSGPGFFKEQYSSLISTDLILSPGIDVVCDARSLPFQSGTVGALVMIDVLHHLPKPLDFIAEAGRVLRPGGRLAMIEPWITPLSFFLYRYFHQEDCCLGVDLAQPFDESNKKAFDGNVAIPFRLIKYFETATDPLRLIRADAFLGLPYLATLGFKCTRQIPHALLDFARGCERLLGAMTRFAATRILVILQRNSEDSYVKPIKI